MILKLIIYLFFLIVFFYFIWKELFGSMDVFLVFHCVLPFCFIYFVLFVYFVLLKRVILVSGYFFVKMFVIFAYGLICLLVCYVFFLLLYFFVWYKWKLIRLSAWHGFYAWHYWDVLQRFICYGLVEYVEFGANWMDLVVDWHHTI